MSFIINWLSENWSMLLVSFGAQAAVVVPIVLSVIKLLAKRAENTTAMTQVNSLITAIQMLQTKLNLINTAVVTLINNTGSEAAKKEYARARAEAETIEKELNARIGEVATVAAKFTKKVKENIEKVISVDTNKAVF